MSARLLLINVYKDSVKVIECDTLDDYYKNLQCDTFDIVRRKIGDRYLDIFCDDEGLLKEEQIVSAVDENGNVELVGNLIIARHNEAGETISLDFDDVRAVMRNLCAVFTYNEEDGLCTHRALKIKRKGV